MASHDPTRPFSIRLVDDHHKFLESRAKRLGVTKSDLGRMIMVEKIAEWKGLTPSSSAEARTLTAITIAALSDTIDLDQAHQLVAEHLTPDASVPS
ncbi:MAG: hypothetical protein U0798_06850 [Gemmataceae bacterium]